jgi:glycosyltransferase involved in cell wall biosynthesis
MGMAMKTGIDCRFASEYAGLGTYTRELTSALLSRTGEDSYTLFVRSAKEPWLSALPVQPDAIVEAPFGHYSFAEQVRFPALIRKVGIDLLFSPHFNVPLFCPVPFVCTVHDLILHKYPNNASALKRFAYRFLMRSSIRRALHIVTISESTRRDLTDYYGDACGTKITVACPGIHPRFRPVPVHVAAQVAGSYGLSGRYLLYVGNAKQHKNVQTLIDAFESLAAPGATLGLIVSGNERSALRFGSSVRVLFGVHDDDLPALYTAASGFATASLYEGFGLPPLEAMACGCAALVSNCGALPEAVNGHAILAEPTVAGMKDGLRKLLDLHGADEAAVAWARGFTWQKTADGVAAALERSW